MVYKPRCDDFLCFRCCVHATLTLSTSPPVSMLRSHFSMSPLSPCYGRSNIFYYDSMWETTKRPVQAAICTVVQPLFRSNRKIKKWCRTKQIHSVLSQSVLSHGTTFFLVEKKVCIVWFFPVSNKSQSFTMEIGGATTRTTEKTIHTGLEYVKLLHSIVSGLLKRQSILGLSM